VVFETNPTYKNLFGSIERVWDRGGQLRADFLRIKAGSVLRADHGFLVINALDALVEPGVWPALNAPCATVSSKSPAATRTRRCSARSG